MPVQVSYPGVYIDEFAPGAPIEGVGTNTAAFIGVAKMGDLRTPTKITSWQGFRDTFGAQPVPGFYLWYAVRGFFDNQGNVCYVVRASNGDYAQVKLPNRASSDLVNVRAYDPGIPASPISVEVVEAHQLQSGNTALYQPTSNNAKVTGTREVQLSSAAEAAKYKPGDMVDLGSGGSPLQVVRVTEATLRLGSNVATAVGSSGPIRLADAPKNATTVRIKPDPTVPVPDGALVQGTMLTITQGAATDTQVVQSVQTESIDPADPTQITYRVTFKEGLNIPLSLAPTDPATVQSEEFNILVRQGASTIQYNNLGADPDHPRYYVQTINASSKLVRFDPIEPPPFDSPPNSLPGIGTVTLAGGVVEDLKALKANHFIEALDTLREVDDVNLVAIPDAMTLVVGTPAVPNVAAITAVQQALVDHCQQMGDRFGVLDSRHGLPLFTAGGKDGVDTQRKSVDSERGYAALYYPWLCVMPQGGGQGILVPPSGHVCGVIAYSDATRGVFKAPANFIVRGTIGVEKSMTDVDQGQLNLLGINVIRVFNTGGRPQLWGARTTATDKNWMYVNVRRLFLYLEESIQEGIRGAVFEPNNPGLWQKLKTTIRAFLHQQWRDGALFGNTPEEAFYVKIDEVLNPFSEQALGRLHIEIGVRPSYPAEFIIVRIGIWQGGSEVSEG